jgi:hypothetical protein
MEGTMSEKYASKAERAAEEKQLVLKLASEKRMRIEHCGENHLKVRGVNFHPSTGTYYRDGQPREPGKGAKDFISFVESRTRPA